MSKVAVFFLALLLLVAGSTVLVLAYRQASDDPAVVDVGSEQVRVLPSEPLESFELTNQLGETFHSDSLDGEVWLASFFFASCPATCRKQNEAIAALQQKYGEDGLKSVAISVDPAADTPSVLTTYAHGFGAEADDWVFLTDRSKRIDYIRRVGQDLFKVPVTTQGHADTLILVGRDGAIVDYFNWKKPERIAELEQAIEQQLAGEKEAGEQESGEEAATPGNESNDEPEPSEENGEKVSS